LFIKACFLAFSALWSTATFAQLLPRLPGAAGPSTPVLNDIVITVAVAAVAVPAFSGSRDMLYNILPDIRLRYRDDVFLSAPDGLGWNVVNRNGWKISPLGKLRLKRPEVIEGNFPTLAGSSRALLGMGTVATAEEIGGFAQYLKGRVWARAEVRQGFGGHHGVVVDLTTNYSSEFRDYQYNFGPRATFASADFINTYYGVSPKQAQATGFPSYSTNGGLVSVGFTGSVIRPVTRNSAIVFFGGLDWLGNAAGNSSLIQQRGQRDQLYAGIAYGFLFGLH
jgi:outer membrane scaffolding protein for murein synthesis (MipA/OmpV family)